MSYIGEGINQTRTSVETSKDEFFGTYYGQISSDPTVDPNGNPITDGDLFYNTSEEALKIRVNGEWMSLRTATTGYQQFTATSGQTTFNVAGSFSPGFVFVTLNGVVLASGDYDDSSGTSIVLTSGAADGDILGVYLFDTFSVADTVSASAGGTFSGPVNFSDNINVDSGTLFVDSVNNRVGVGTSSPVVSLDVVTGGDERILVGTVGVDSVITAVNGDNTAFQPMQINGSDILFLINGSEAARIDSSGRLVFNPKSITDENNSIFANSNGYMYVEGNTSGLILANNSSSNCRVFIQDNDIIRFLTSGSDAARIDSSGNLLVGTSQIGGARGLSILPDFSNGSARLYFTKPGNGLESFGITFQDGSSTTGFIKYDSSGVKYSADGTQTVSLEPSGLTFDGGSNYLDDYEEGTWTISLEDSSGSVAYTDTSPIYRKVGSIVTLQGDLRSIPNSGLTGTVFLGGLPFNQKEVVGGTAKFRSNPSGEVSAIIWGGDGAHGPSRPSIVFCSTDSLLQMSELDGSTDFVFEITYTAQT